MIDPDELDAIAEAVFAEEDETLSLLVAPSLVLELAYDFASYHEALADMLATLQVPTGDNAKA